MLAICYSHKTKSNEVVHSFIKEGFSKRVCCLVTYKDYSFLLIMIKQLYTKAYSTTSLGYRPHVPN